MAQDSSKPDFWDTRVRQNVTPWDAGRVPAALQRFVARHALRGMVTGTVREDWAREHHARWNAPD